MLATDLASVKWLPCSSFVYCIVGPFWRRFGVDFANNQFIAVEKFPFPDVTIQRVEEASDVKDPVFIGNTIMVNQKEFFLKVDGVGSFYAFNGMAVEC
ncbi:MAG: hypothetical protein MZU84_05030 [Sphingobacterium sp.]|nr:hypothetical protein [Sphingobacterium sp.]